MKRKLLIVAAIFIFTFSTTGFADCLDGEINHGTRQCEDPGLDGEIGHGNFLDGEVNHGNFLDGEIDHGNLWNYILTVFSK